MAEFKYNWGDDVVIGNDASLNWGNRGQIVSRQRGIYDEYLVEFYRPEAGSGSGLRWVKETEITQSFPRANHTPAKPVIVRVRPVNRIGYANVWRSVDVDAPFVVGRVFATQQEAREIGPAQGWLAIVRIEIIDAE